MRRLIVANFDCELRYAQTHCPGPHKALPRDVCLAISRAAPALAVFARETDSLWTMAPLEGDESPLALVSGPLSELDSYDALLPWGQSDELPSVMLDTAIDSSWQDELWRLRASPGAAAACNDRRFCLALEVEEEWTLPCRSSLDCIEMLDEYIATRPLGPGDAWVAKAPFAASGRERLRRHGRVLEGELRVRAQRLLQRYGQLVIEPWMPRVADFGMTGMVGASPDCHRVFAPHQLHSDGTGVFRGIRIADAETTARLGPAFAKALANTAFQVVDALFERGYRGAFGIDAFVYTDDSGAERLHSLCEINARLCFGLVARAQAERLGLDEFEFTL